MCPAKPLLSERRATQRPFDLLTLRPSDLSHGPAATDRRTNPQLDPGRKGPLVAGECLPRRHASVDGPRGGDRDAVGRDLVADESLCRGQDRLDAGHRHHFGDSRLWDVQNPVRAGDGSRVHGPGKQLYAVDCDGRRLHDRAADFVAGGVHDGDQHGHTDADDDRLDHIAVATGRAVCLSAETPVHQRRAASVPGRSSGRDRDGRVAQRRSGRRLVQGQDPDGRGGALGGAQAADQP